MIVWHRDPGTRVAAGEILAEILDPIAGTRVAVASATDGLFFARPQGRLVRPGQQVGKIAGRVKLAHRKPGALLNL